MLRRHFHLFKCFSLLPSLGRCPASMERSIIFPIQGATECVCKQVALMLGTQAETAWCSRALRLGKTFCSPSPRIKHTIVINTTGTCGRGSWDFRMVFLLSLQKKKMTGNQRSGSAGTIGFSWQSGPGAVTNWLDMLDRKAKLETAGPRGRERVWQAVRTVNKKVWVSTLYSCLVTRKTGFSGESHWIRRPSSW